ncbi:MAG TPA: hypothetical protein VGC54_10420 [Planctomycetota bacterium]
MSACTLAFTLAACAFPAAQDPAVPVRIGGVEYVRQADRASTRAFLLDALQPRRVVWGDWWLLSPFAYAGHGRDDLKTPQAPELELPKLRAGGAGPDLAASYRGKDGFAITWRPLGEISDQRVELRRNGSAALHDNSVCYLYGTVEASTAMVLELVLGSDDGLRLWHNGRLVLDKDVPRSLDPDTDRVQLVLTPGVNHLLAKVCNGGGDWAFQFRTRPQLDPRVEAELEYRLDLDFPPSPERLHWRVLTVPEPPGSILEVGGLDFLPDGRPVVCTRRGEVWIVAGAYAEPPVDVSYTLFAEGLHEPLGLAVREERGRAVVYSVQRPELTRMVDLDGDDRADVYECVNADWGVSGNYHEFAFGPKFDAEGNAWVTLNVGFCGSLGKSVVHWRGWAFKITPAGELVPVASGLRSPNGIGMWHGEVFYLDNQGDYVGTNKLAHLQPGSWHGHPSSVHWRDDWRESAPLPARMEPAIWFPYGKMGQSSADLAVAPAGTFGPFAGQGFVGDQTRASILRVNLEEIDGVFQGSCHPFLTGLASGVNRLAFAADGSLFVGMTDRGWGSVGPKRQGLQRVVYTGAVPFELASMHVESDGFRLEFTQDLDEAAAADPRSYRMVSYTYEWHAEYGSPEMDAAPHRVLAADLAGPRTVRLRIDRLREGFVHELQMPGVRARAGGAALLHAEAYYTLQRVPGR